MTKILNFSKNYDYLYKQEACFIMGLITHPAIHKKTEKIYKKWKIILHIKV